MKIFKRIVACALAAMLAVGALTSCGTTSSSGSSNKQTIAPIASPTGQVAQKDSRTHKFYASHDLTKMSADMDVTRIDAEETKDSKITIAWDKASSKICFLLPDYNSNVLIDGETIYLIRTKAQKVYGLNMSSSKNKVTETLSDIVSPDSDEILDYGTLSIDGVSYYFESSTKTDDDGNTKTTYYCFDEADTEGTRLLCVIRETPYKRSIFKITSSSTEVDASVFTIPEDYKVITLGLPFANFNLSLDWLAL